MNQSNPRAESHGCSTALDSRCESFNMCIGGPRGSGKTSLLNAFFGMPFGLDTSPTQAPTIRHAIIETEKGYIHVKFTDFPGQQMVLNTEKLFWNGAIVVRDFTDEKEWGFQDNVFGITVKSKADEMTGSVKTDPMKKYLGFTGPRAHVSAKSRWRVAEPFEYLLRKLTKIEDLVISNKPIVEVVFGTPVSGILGSESMHAHGMSRLSEDDIIQLLINWVNINTKPHSDQTWQNMAEIYDAVRSVHRYVPGNICQPRFSYTKEPRAQLPAQVPVQLPAQAPVQLPAQVPVQLPAETAKKAPNKISEETPNGPGLLAPLALESRCDPEASLKPKEFDFEGAIRRAELEEARLIGLIEDYNVKRNEIASKISVLKQEENRLYGLVKDTKTAIENLWSEDDQIQDFQNCYNCATTPKRAIPDVSDEVKDAVRKALQKQIAVAFFGTKHQLQAALNKLK